MAYMNKTKKKYKLNKNVKKAVDGQIVEDVVEAPLTLLEYLEDFIDKLTSGIADIDLDFNIGLGKGKGKGKGKKKIGREEAGIKSRLTKYGGVNPFSDFKSLGFDNTGFFTRVYPTGDWNHVPMGTKLEFPEGKLTDETKTEKYQRGLKSKWGRFYDYADDEEYQEDRAGGATGRVPNFSRRAAPILQDIETASGELTLRPGYDHFDRLMQLSPEMKELLMRMSHNYAKRENLSEDQLRDIYNLKEGNLSTSDDRFLQPYDDKAMKKYIKSFVEGMKRYKKNPTTGNLPKGNPLFDLAMYQFAFGDDSITLQDADMFGDLLKGDKVKFAIADMHPDYVSKGNFDMLGFDEGFAFNEGAVGGAAKMRTGNISDEMRENLGPDAEFVKGTSQNYIENFKQSGFKNEQNVGEDWQLIQNAADDGTTPGLGRNEVSQKLLDDNSIFAQFNQMNPNSRGIFDERTNQYLNKDPRLQQIVGMYNIRFDEETGQHYRLTAAGNRSNYLTPEQETAYRNAVVDKFIDDSGWQSASDQPTEAPQVKQIGMVPSSGVDYELPSPTGSIMGFTDDGSGDVGGDLNDMNNLDKNQDPVVDSKSRDKSINAILSSVRNQTHIKTGEEYNPSDLKRDSKIIKDKFGDDAYDSLMNQLNQIPSIKQPSNIPLVDSDDDNREAGDRDRVRVDKKNNNKQPLFASADGEGSQGDDADKSVTEQIQNIRNRGDEEEMTEEEMRKKEEEERKKMMLQNMQAPSGGGDGDWYDLFGVSPFFNYRDGGFGPKYKSFKSFEDGGMNNPFSSIADRFRGGGSSGFGSGFKIPTFAGEDANKAGEIYLEAKVMGIENEIDKFKQVMDVNSEEDQAKLVAMQTSLEETKEELFMLRGGQVTRTSMNMENNNNTDDNLVE